MSRRHGGRPAYGWSMRQQGGFRKAKPVRPPVLLKSRHPTERYNAKVTIGTARGLDWYVVAVCDRCGHEGWVRALGLVDIRGLDRNLRLKDLRSRLRCQECGSKNGANLRYELWKYPTG